MKSTCGLNDNTKSSREGFTQYVLLTHCNLHIANLLQMSIYQTLRFEV